VPQRVGGAVKAGRLAVPDAGHAVVLGVTDLAGQLGAGYGRRRQLLVEAGPVQDAVLGEHVTVAGEFKVVAAKRGTLVTGHVGGRRETVLPVETGAVEQHADERLDPREVDRPVLELIALVEAGHAESCRHEVTLDSHWSIGLVSRAIIEPLAQ
jgi:hypothetical protein